MYSNMLIYAYIPQKKHTVIFIYSHMFMPPSHIQKAEYVLLYL